MNLLFIHEVDWQKKVIFDMHEFAESLSILGHTIYVIDYQDTWKRNNWLDFGYIRTRDVPNSQRIYKDASIFLIRPGFLKIPVLDRLSAMITHYVEIKRTIKKYKIDAIILYSVPTNGLQTVLLARKFKVPVVFRSIDILHGLVRPKILSRITLFFEKIVYRNVDFIVALTPKLADYVINLGADKKRVKLLLFGVDTTKFHPVVDVSALKNILHIEKKDKIIIFIGTFFDFSGIDLFVQQFPMVLKEIPEAKLILVGGGSLFDHIKKIIQKLNLKDNVILTGFQPFELMPEFINLADLCINPFQINEATKDIIPGKIYQYLACAKPVLATPLQGMKELLPDENYGVFYSDIDDFAKKTIILLKNQELMKNVGFNGYKQCIENNEKWDVVKQLERILYNLDSNNKSKGTRNHDS